MPYPDRAFEPARRVNPLEQVAMIKHKVGTTKLNMINKVENYADSVAKNKNNPIGLRAYASNALPGIKDAKAKLSDQVYNTGTFFQEKR